MREYLSRKVADEATRMLLPEGVDLQLIHAGSGQW